MNKFDTEFWNGILKGKIDDILILEKLKENLSSDEKKVADACIMALKLDKERIEKVHAKDVRLGVSNILNDRLMGL